MKFNNLITSIILVLTLSLTTSCKNVFRWTDATEVPVNAQERVQKNLEEGRGIQFGIGKNSGKGGTFDFASSNELWRASIEILDFVSFTNASYSGGIIITDWFAGSKESSNNKDLRELKITIRFLTNEIRSDALDIKIFYKKCKTVSNCIISEQDSSLKNELRKEILKKAALYKSQSNKKSLKKYDYPENKRN